MPAPRLPREPRPNQALSGKPRGISDEALISGNPLHKRLIWAPPARIELTLTVPESMMPSVSITWSAS